LPSVPFPVRAYFVILTLGLSEFAKYIFINYEVNVKGTVGRILLGVPSIKTLYFSLLVIACFTILCAYLIQRSRFGYGLFSIRENEDAAESLGIDTSLYKWLAFGISAFFPGAVGSVMALRRTYIVYSVFDPIVSSDHRHGISGRNGKAPRPCPEAFISP
jgi:branched-chain amino acid transport system permease protein